MARTDEIGGNALQSFMDTWKQHPLSFFAVLVSVTMASFFMLTNNKINANDTLAVVISTYVFAGIILLGILAVLLFRKEALYNAIHFLAHDIEYLIHVLQEMLREVQLGIGDREDEIERMCPKAARVPIEQHTRKEVQSFEILNDIIADCDIPVPIDRKTNLALAKFYYKVGDFRKALEKIVLLEQSRDEKTDKKDPIPPGEIDFCHGLIFMYFERYGTL